MVTWNATGKGSTVEGARAAQPTLLHGGFMHPVRLILTSLSVAAAFPAVARAEPAAAHADESARKFADITHSYSTPARARERWPGAVQGHARPDARDHHRLRIRWASRVLARQRTPGRPPARARAGYDHAARSDSRNLAFITPQLIVETGHPLILQLAVGPRSARGPPTSRPTIRACSPAPPCGGRFSTSTGPLRSACRSG